MRILFVYPDFGVNKTPEGHVTYESGGWYNDGLASLSATLKQHGHETALCHLLWPPSKDDFQNGLRRHNPGLVAFSLRSEVFRVGSRFALWAKELGYPTIAGSYHPTLAPEEAIAAPGIDMICLGEGELALAELCDRLDAGRDPSDIAGLWVKRGAEIIRNPVRPLVENLDDLPIPDFALFDFAKLTSTQTYTGLVSLTRGCPYNCTYCCNHALRSIYPNRKQWLRSRSPQNAIAYIRALQQAYPQVRYLRVTDDIFHWDEAWLAEFAGLYKAEFTMPLAVHHRPNLFTARMAALLREIGCYQIYFGVESGSEFIRSNVLRRQMSNAQIEQAFAYAHKAGMITAAYNMVGLPFETPQRVLETIKLNARIGANRIFNPVFYPFPNTDLWRTAVQEGFCPPNADYEMEAVCSMPDLPADRIRFVSANFKMFVRLYRLAHSLPGPAGKGLERLIDRAFLSRRLPHGLLTDLARAQRKALADSKSLLRQYTPSFYLFVRDRLLGNRL